MWLLGNEVLLGALIIAMALLSFTRHGKDRYIILAFAALCGFFQLISNSLGNYQYYLGAAITDLIIINLISKIVKPTATIINLQKIALWFIYVNTIGWIIYELYYPPFLYNTICLALFISALVVAVRKGGDSGLGSITSNSNDFTIRGGYNSCNTQMQVYKKKVRT